jgi:hypothetical protein
MNGRGGDSGVAERGVELGIGLRVRFHQGVDLLDQFGVVDFGLVPPPSREIVEAADTGAVFAEAGRNGFAAPAEDLLSASRFPIAVLESHLGLELATTKAGHFAGGEKDDVLHRGRQGSLHDRILFHKGATSWQLVAAM